MKKIFTLFLALLSNQIFAQLNLQFKSNIPYPDQLSNIGGYVDHAGNEYALVGWYDGMDIVDVTDPANPVIKFTVPGNPSTWREIKTYRDYAYVTTEECCDGLQIVDLSLLPVSINTTTYTGDGAIAGEIETIHALHIDTATAFLYLFGTNIDAGASNNGYPLFIDISDPLNPTYAGRFIINAGNPYVHDGYVENDTAYFGHIYEGIVSIVDVSDKSNPVLLATQQTPNAFTHNVWLSDDHQTMFTTDETSDSYLTAYDISDLGNITELSRFQTDPGSQSVVHNTHILNDYAVTSWYTQGVVITDVDRPWNPIEVGHYDTHPSSNGSGFSGDWGVYPYLPSGNLVVSDMNAGLFVLAPTYVRGCYLEGEVTDSVTGMPLGNATVTILTANITRTTNITGDYYSGTAAAGTYDVQFSKSGYYTKVISGVNLINGVLVNLNVELVCINCVALNGQIVEAGTGNPIPNATIQMSSGTTFQTLMTDANGNFNASNFIGGTYDVVAGIWGYQTYCQVLLIDATTSPLIITLDIGYYDDFAIDFGWTPTSSTHDWQRGEPDGTTSQGNQSNPEFDVSTDCLDQCYVTDNGGGNDYDHDIDPGDGTVVLTSPVFDLSGYADPELSYYRWFFNGELNGNQPNDQMIVRLTNGITSVVLETILNNTTGNSSWVFKTYDVASVISPTANMHLTVETSDVQPSSIVEGGLDNFEIVDNGVGIENAGVSSTISIQPNPFHNLFTLRGLSFDGEQGSVEVYNSLGEMIHATIIAGNNEMQINASSWAPGIYVIRFTTNTGAVKQMKATKVN